MSTSMTPSLFTSKDQLVTIPDRVADLLTYAIANPGNTTSMWAGSEISIPYLVNMYESNLDSLIGILGTKLNSALSKMFDGEGINADVSYVVMDSDRNIYKLIINIVYSDGSAVLRNSDILVDTNGVITLNLK